MARKERRSKPSDAEITQLRAAKVERKRLAALEPRAAPPPPPPKPSPRTAPDPVGATADESLRAKASLEGLDADVASPFDAALYAASTKRGPARRPSPLALGVCRARVTVARRALDAAVAALGPGARVVGVGAGLDGEALRLLARHPGLSAVEVDVAAVVRRKRDLLRACAFAVVGDELESADDGGDGVFVRYARLSLASVPPGGGAAALDAAAGRGPGRTLVYCEVSLCYAPRAVGAAAEAWAAALPGRALWLEVAPLAGGDSPLAAAAARGFARSRAPLAGAAPSPAARAAQLGATFARAVAVDLAAAFGACRGRDAAAAGGAAGLALARRRYVVAAASDDAAAAEAALAPRPRPAARVRRFRDGDAAAARRAYVAAMAELGDRTPAVARHARRTAATVFASAAAVRDAFGDAAWVAVDGGGAVAGFAAVAAATGGDPPELRCVAVAPERRGAGLGRALLDAALAALAERGDRAVFCRALGGAGAAAALYEAAGFAGAASRVVAGGGRSWELRRLEARLAPLPRLRAAPLEPEDRSKARAAVPDAAPAVHLRLPQPLHATLSLVLDVGGDRYVARRSNAAAGAPPLPAGTLVAVDVDADAPPQWAWPRRVNTFRSAKPAPKPGADPCGAEEDGPCTCNQDCVLA